MYKIKNYFKWYTFKTYLNKVNYSFLSVHYDTEINVFCFVLFLLNFYQVKVSWPLESKVTKFVRKLKKNPY